MKRVSKAAEDAALETLCFMRKNAFGAFFPNGLRFGFWGLWWLFYIVESILGNQVLVRVGWCHKGVF